VEDPQEWLESGKINGHSRADRAWWGMICANPLGINCAFTVDLMPFPMRAKN
jgi:hypothetical protein